MTWINLPSVSVQSGSKTVTVSNVQTTHIKVGDALLIGNYQPVEISGVFATQLTLRENWSNAAQTNVVAVVMPTSGDFVTATKVLKEATETTRSNFAALEKWATQMGTVEFKGQDNTTHTGRTFKQMDADVAELEAQASNLIINVSGRGFARSEADMLAMRAANATKFAASGMIHPGKHFSEASVNEGLSAYTSSWGASPNRLWLGRNSTAGGVAGTSDTDYALFNLAGFQVKLLGIGDGYNGTSRLASIKFPEAPDGTVTYDSATGAVVKHPDAATAFASETATNKVVTERVDLAGLEAYLEQITPDKPYIYPYGCIQSQATTVDGIATTVDNIRPITYFAVFDGDESSRGRGWNINTLTDAQKEKIFSNPEHNIFRMNNGDLVQFRVRQRTIAGAGNGDWERINSAENLYLTFRDGAGEIPMYVNAQGNQDTVEPLRSSSVGSVLYCPRQTSSTMWGDPNFRDKGVYKASAGYGYIPTGRAYNGECYFYVLDTVLRLNKGAHHPWNELGSQPLNKPDGWGEQWNKPGVIQPATKADLFKKAATIDGVGTPFNTNLGGSIASDTAPGRPDGKCYDAIYPDGVGGVIDRRLSAFPITMADYFKAMAKAENGTMRGMEKLSRSKPFVTTYQDAIKQGSGTLIYINGAFEFLTNSILKPDGVYPNMRCNGYIISQVGTNANGNYVYIHNSEGDVSAKFPLGTAVILTTNETNLSVSGNFLQIDVIGDPANVLQVDALKDGWMGSFIQDLGISRKQLTRDCVGSSATLPILWTTNLGSSWLSGAQGFDSVTNSIDTWNASDTVAVVQYSAAAKVTKPSSASKVYGYKKGLGSVITTQDYRTEKGALLAESLMGQVLTSNASGKRYGSCPLTSDLVGHDGLLYNVAGYLPEHQPTTMSQPDNASPAIKILPHAASENGQATLAFVWNELKHNGAGWGDDSSMRVIGGTGTYNNLNGQSCLYGYAVSALPIGWVDNHARFGAQVPGVDL
ncbi:hypothetical protein [Vibrio vulnificus]|uniref:hypothetical protein n=1 Tax=Vibrio vulnificus TaxID=672 RepID=UPI000C7D53C3|nr:hypothetical protein [Vibrio vulnificus]AUL97501.1 hypothetical protein FORC54_3356 [Vibrio vulnificus]